MVLATETGRGDKEEGEYLEEDRKMKEGRKDQLLASMYF